MAINTLPLASPLSARIFTAESKKHPSISVKSSTNQQKSKKYGNKTLTSSFTHTAEIDSAIAGLERMFLQPGVDPPNSGRFFDKRDRRPVRIAYQGVPGSYCHEAAMASFPFAVQTFPSGSSMEDAFSAIESGSADRSIVPAENSLDGPIDRNLDLLLRHPAIRIAGEHLVSVNHCLLAVQGVQISNIRRIVSHPQAINHCLRRIRSLDVDLEEVSDVVEAARAVAKDGIGDTAVIGSRIAAEEFGLQIIQQHIQDDGGNFNRFFELGPAMESPPECGENVKTTLAFSLLNGVSDLFRAMRVFQTGGVQVTKIDHRPKRRNPIRFVNRNQAGGREVVQMDYIFVVDVSGSESNAHVAAAIEQLREISDFVRVLGCYSCADIA